MTGRARVGARLAVASAALLALSHPSLAGDLDVVVTGVRGGRGTVRVALCAEDQFLSFECAYKGEAVALDGRATIRLKDVLPGIYAVEAFHDVDNSGRLELSPFGIPRKAIGFSNDAAMRYGPPRFADAAIALSAAGGQVLVALRYPE